MQVNHEEVDTVLNARVKHIKDGMMHMQQEVETQRQGWTKVCT